MPRSPRSSLFRRVSGVSAVSGISGGSGLLTILGLITTGALLTPLAGCGKTSNPKALFDEAAFYGKQQASAPELPGGPATTAPPMSLTCSDGTGLQLRGLRANAVVEGPLAFTELHLTFYNPEPRQREGRFAITLPPGAAINRFAMYTHKWMEGEVVEKQQARRIYEDYLHRKQDPALLENDAGNTFRARVFPIPARGEKQLILSYTTELVSGNAPYVLPLAGLGTIRDFGAIVAVHDKPREDARRSPHVIQVDQRDFRPKEDLVVHPSAVKGPAALRNGDLVAARVTLADKRGKQGFGEVLLMLDTSASEAVDFKGRVGQVEQLLAFIAKNGASRVKVVAFDQVAVQIFDGAPGKWGKEERGRLLRRGALGASNWSAALKSVPKFIAGRDKVRVLVFGNGVATAGQTRSDQLKAAAAALKGAGVTRLDTLEVAAQRDMDVLRALATAGLPEDGVHVQLAGGDAKPDFSALSSPTFSEIQVAVKGAKWTWPRTLRGLRGGDSALIYAQQDGDKVEVELTGGAKEKFVIEPVRASRALLETAWVSARIKRLLHDGEFGDPDMRPMAKKQALKLSIKHRVLCELTALLVLESDAEYARYNLDQTALADILAVNNDLEVATMDRQHAYDVARRQPLQQAAEKEQGLLDSIKAKLGMANEGKYVARAQKQEEQISETYEIMVEEKEEAPEDEAEGAPVAAALEPQSSAPPRPSLDAPARASKAPPKPEPQAEAKAMDPKVRKPTQRRVVAKKTIGGGFIGNADAAKLFGSGGEGGGTAIARAFGDEEDRAVTGGKVAMKSRSGSSKGGVRAAGGLGRRPLIPDRPGRPVGAIVERPSPAELAAKRERVRLRRERQRMAKQRAALQAQQAKLEEERRKLEEERRAKERAEAGKRELAELRAGTSNQPNLQGRYAKVRDLIDRKKLKTAVREAWEWRQEDVGNVLALVALGDAFTAQEEPEMAARAYGSLIDLFPSRADLRRFAGNLLEASGDDALLLAIDTYLAAIEQRPDHPAGYHMAAMALAKKGQLGDAIALVKKGLSADRRSGNFQGVDEILRDDLAMLEQAQNGSGNVPPNLRFVLTWETDANDVDFHIFDNVFQHASYRHRELQSGGRLYADITTGYGPECFRIDNPTAYPYQLLAHYYAMGPMGYGMGRLQVLRYDGKKGFGVENRPFVIMQDRAYVDMGAVTAKTARVLH